MSVPVIVYVAVAGPVAPTVLIDAPPLDADIDMLIVISFAINYPHLGTDPAPSDCSLVDLTNTPSGVLSMVIELDPKT